MFEDVWRLGNDKRIIVAALEYNAEMGESVVAVFEAKRKQKKRLFHRSLSPVGGKDARHCDVV